jgi:photosystem II stability/assembly factor-like uncharacterized protein
LGRTIYGYGADFESRREQFLVSQDGGRNWRRRPAPQPIVSLAVDPRDPDRLVASGPEELLASSNGGRYWSRVESGAGLLSWSASQDLFRVDAAGTVSGSADGRTWVSTGKIGGRPAAFEVAGRELYVALHDGTIKQSGDGGRTWAVRLAAPD